MPRPKLTPDTQASATTQALEDLSAADSGSYYTICGAGGDLNDWINGLTEYLTEREIGIPVAWYVTTGAAVNAYAGPTTAERDRFPDDLTILLFPLDGLDIGRLAPLKIAMGDRWFDDVVANMRDD